MEKISDLLAALGRHGGAGCENANPNARPGVTAGAEGLFLREDGARNVFVAGLQVVPVATEGQLLALLDAGSALRATGSTEMNVTSSRSHAIFTIYVRSHDRAKGVVNNSKFHLVDLAGSERAKKTKAKGDRMQSQLEHGRREEHGQHVL
jgi:hypothetical protein